MIQPPLPSVQQRSYLVPILVALLVFVAFLVYAWPSIGHAGFLADQVDQLGAFEALLHGKAKALYGPFMSNTVPPVYNLGPIAAVLFGLPTLVGGSPDAVHGFFIVLLAISFAFCIYAMACRSLWIAVFWAGMLFCMPIMWWHASLLWASMLPLVVSFTLFGFFILFVSTKRPWFGLAVAACFIAGVSLHTNPVVSAPLVLLTAAMLVRQHFWSHRPKTPTILVLLVIGGLLAPYIVAEIVTGGANTRAAIANIHHNGAHVGHDAGWQAAKDSLRIAFKPLDFTGGLGPFALVPFIFAMFYGFGRTFWHWRRSLAKSNELLRAEDWLLFATPILIASQCAFYLLVNRTLQGPHYTSFLTPLYILPLAVLVADVVSWLYQRYLSGFRQQPLRLMLPLIVAILFIWHGGSQASSAFESSPWNFRSILDALQTICLTHPNVRTLEGPSFVTYDPEYDPVLTYIVRHYRTGCRLDPSSNILLNPTHVAPSPVIEQWGARFVLVDRLPPGINVYSHDGNSNH